MTLIIPIKQAPLSMIITLLSFSMISNQAGEVHAANNLRDVNTGHYENEEATPNKDNLRRLLLIDESTNITDTNYTAIQKRQGLEYPWIPKHFGSSWPERIIGGSNVGPETYPWFARGTYNNHKNWWGCAGSLVTPEFVLSAGKSIIYTT